jgi:poly(glycerol-phosphate) alpha-glucosyltransferase
VKVSFVTASVSRIGGGIFYSLCGLSKGLVADDVDVKVLALNDAYTEADSNQLTGVDLGVYKRIGPSSFGYSPSLKEALRNEKFDLIHSHGLWMYPSAVSGAIAKKKSLPNVISPHGMLDSWALLNSAWKKSLAGALFENTHLHGASCIHALNYSEYIAIRNYGLKNPVALIPNGVYMPDISQHKGQPDWARNIKDDGMRLLYLGRIHPKKGISNLLHAWAKVISDRKAHQKPWELIIAGWDQGGHQGELENLVVTLNIKDSVRFIGPQFNEQKELTLSYADAFILPSLSEGFPMAVLEAWSYAKPVLMSSHCNIPEGFDSGAAMESGTDVDDIQESLIKLFSMDISQLKNMGDNGLQLVEQNYTWKNVSQNMLKVYEWLLGDVEKPEFVILD